MDKRKLKQLAKDMAEKGFDRRDVLTMVEARHNLGQFTKEDGAYIVKQYDLIKEDIESMSIGFFEKRRLRKLIKKMRKGIESAQEEGIRLAARTKKLNREQQAELDELKQKMIVAILGDKTTATEGLNNIFSITDDSGNEMTAEEMNDMSIEEIEEMLTELLDMLEKEI